jgi:hypothetical protein
MAKRSALSSQKNFFQLLPIDCLEWTQLGSKFDPRTVLCINRIMGNLQMTTLPEQVNFLSENLEQRTPNIDHGAELSPVLGRTGSWAYGMIAEHFRQLGSPEHLHPGRPRLVDVPLEDAVI